MTDCGEMFSKKTVTACALGLVIGIVVSPVMWLTYSDPLLQSVNPMCGYGTLEDNPASYMKTTQESNPLDWLKQQGYEKQNFIRKAPPNEAGFNLTVDMSNHTVTPKGNPKVRYRHISSEVAPRKILFIGVVTAEKYLDTRAVGINNTWGRGQPDLHYFSSHPKNRTINLPIISLQGVNDSVYPPQKKVYAMLKYMHDHFIDEFDFFMRADDDVYVKTDLLLELLRGINPAQEIYMGSPGFGRPDDKSRIKLQGGEHYCMGGPGVIFSRSALKRLAPHLDTCLKSVVVSYNEDVEVGRCVSKMLKIQCTWSWEVTYLFWTDYKHILGTPELYSNPNVVSAITLHPLKDPQLMYRVHQYVQKLALRRHMRKAAAMQQDLQRVSALVPEVWQEFKLNKWLWYDISTNPASRHKLSIWQYFNSTNLFLNYEHLPVISLPSDLKSGINLALEVLVETMNSKQDLKNQFVPPYHLFDGFLLTELSSGIQYTLNLSLHQEGVEEPVHYVASVFLPFQGAGMVLYEDAETFENSVVHIIINVGKDANISPFLSVYEEVCIREGMMTHLHVVHFGTGGGNARAQVTDLVSRHPTEPISSYELLESSFSHSNGFRHVADKLLPDDLLLLMDYNFIFTKEFIWHAQMNAVRGHQAYFPILFSFYKPELVSRYLPRPPQMIITPDTGFFLRYNYQVVSIYKSDYDLVSRVEIDAGGGSKNDDVRFVDKAIASEIYVMRALEPYLRRNFRPRSCDGLSSNSRSACMNSKADSIGSKKMLGALLTHHDLLDAV